MTQHSLLDFLENVAKLNKSDYSPVLNNNTIRIGLAFSGGSYRAMLTGAGQISALDSRTPNATQNALGGLLQLTTYLAGISGGNWLVGTLALNNWTSVHEIIYGQHSIWLLKHSFYEPDGLNIWKDISDWKHIFEQVHSKKKLGFVTSVIDYWSRALLRQFFDHSTDYGALVRWSDIQHSQPFKSGQMPFPISVSNLRDDENVRYWNTLVVFETNPFEFGSWDSSLNAFTNLKYLGSKIFNGRAVGSVCYNGFDNGGFIMGTSLLIFDSIIDNMRSVVKKIKVIGKMIDGLFEDLFDGDVQAIYSPNPFFASEHATLKEVTNQQELALVDGGTDYQNIPFQPMLNPDRQVDIIFAFDLSSDDTSVWPNGASLFFTYSRQFSNNGPAKYSFPPVPLPETFVARNYTKRPVFFGCDASALKNLANIPPLVVYSANANYSFNSNTSTFKLEYSKKEKEAMIRNGYELMSRNNLTDDSNWQGCVGCAIIRRSQERADIPQSEFCQQCFREYCWDGTH